MADLIVLALISGLICIATYWTMSHPDEPVSLRDASIAAFLGCLCFTMLMLVTGQWQFLVFEAGYGVGLALGYLKYHDLYVSSLDSSHTSFLAARGPEDDANWLPYAQTIKRTDSN